MRAQPDIQEYRLKKNNFQRVLVRFPRILGNETTCTKKKYTHKINIETEKQTNEKSRSLGGGEGLQESLNIVVFFCHLFSVLCIFSSMGCFLFSCDGCVFNDLFCLCVALLSILMGGRHR